MWDLPGPGLKPVSPALAGGFLITVPPGKSHIFCFYFLGTFLQHIKVRWVKLLNDEKSCKEWPHGQHQGPILMSGTIIDPPGC